MMPCFPDSSGARRRHGALPNQSSSIPREGIIELLAILVSHIVSPRLIELDGRLAAAVDPPELADRVTTAGQQRANPLRSGHPPARDMNSLTLAKRPRHARTGATLAP